MIFYNYKKKGRLKLSNFKFDNLKFGTVGLKAVKSGIISLKQIQLFKQMIFKSMAYKVKIWVRKFSHFNITKKSIGIRMGKGHGKISIIVLKINCGDIIFEFCSLKFTNLLNFIFLFRHKLKIKTKIIINKFLNLV